MLTSNRPVIFFPKADLQSLINSLRADGYDVIGPTIDQNAIVLNSISSTSQLPIGWTDDQAPGTYRLKQCEGGEWFGFTVGPQSWKQYLFPPRTTLLTVQPTESGWAFVAAPPEVRKQAFLGVRACELAAIRVQDRVFLEGPAQDPVYRQRRESSFLVAVNCTQAASTCFCTSMNTGPRCEAGFDLALTEISTGFLCEIGSDHGAKVLTAVNPRVATSEELAAAQQRRERAVEQISRHLKTEGLRESLQTHLNDPRWQQIGERCLSCANCTLVCPTCFCSSVSEVRDLNTGEVQRQRTWDSCFNPDFSYLSSGAVRTQTADRYRQWLTHKLGTWYDQFDMSGCVGCGRCITWCPVCIDMTEEANAFVEGAT